MRCLSMNLSMSLGINLTSFPSFTNGSRPALMWLSKVLSETLRTSHAVFLLSSVALPSSALLVMGAGALSIGAA